VSRRASPRDRRRRISRQNSLELYDLSPLSNSKLGNTSTCGSVGIGDNVLIGGFIVGDVESATLVVRALGHRWLLLCERSAKRSHTDDLRLDWLHHREQ
jgi:hypothetical protein